MPGTRKASEEDAPQAEAQKQPGEGKKYRFIGDRAVILEGGQPLGPGEYVTLTDEQAAGGNQMLINEGKLIDASEVDQPTPETTKEEGSE